MDQAGYSQNSHGAKYPKDFVYLMNLDTGELDPVKGDVQRKGRVGIVFGAVFSPDGETIAYFYPSDESHWHLAVRSLSGGKEEVLANPKTRGFGSYSPTQGLSWASDNTILVTTSSLLYKGNRLRLYQLKTG